MTPKRGTILIAFYDLFDPKQLAIVEGTPSEAGTFLAHPRVAMICWFTSN